MLDFIVPRPWQRSAGRAVPARGHPAFRVGASGASKWSARDDAIPAQRPAQRHAARDHNRDRVVCVIGRCVRLPALADALGRGWLEAGWQGTGVRRHSACWRIAARRKADAEIPLLFSDLYGRGSIVGRVQCPRHSVLALQFAAFRTERDVGGWNMRSGIYFASTTSSLRREADLWWGIHIAPASSSLRSAANLWSGVHMAPASSSLRRHLEVMLRCEMLRWRWREFPTSPAKRGAQCTIRWKVQLAEAVPGSKRGDNHGRLCRGKSLSQEICGRPSSPARHLVDRNRPVRGSLAGCLAGGSLFYWRGFPFCA